MRRLRVLIVEDEKRIARLIAKLIHWDEEGLESLGFCEDGRQGYQTIVDLEPDIVITDVRMPILDGLEMIRLVREEGPEETRFVVISGYREFEYAHTALRYGVEDYLLKPINEEELNETLRSLVSAFSEEASNREKAARDSVRKRELQAKEAVDRLSQAGWDDDLVRFNDEFDLDLRDDRFRAFCTKIDHREKAAIDGAQDLLVQRNVLRLLSEHLQPCSSGQLYGSETELAILGFVSYEAGMRDAMEAAYQTAFSAVKRYVYAFSQYEVTLALGNERDFHGVHESLVEAKRGIRERIVFGTGRVIATDSWSSRKSLHGSAEFFAAVPLEVANAVQSFSSPTLFRVIDASFMRIREKHQYDADAYIETAAVIVRGVYEKDPDAEDEQALLREIRDCWSVPSLIELLKNRLGAKILALQAKVETQSIRPVREAIAFIQEHYAERITLESVADRLILNPTYLSSLFKKETGVNFLAYLTECRIEKAKDLLRTTNETMASIASQVGYSDTRYFSQSFERVAGLKPSLYRKMYA